MRKKNEAKSIFFFKSIFLVLLVVWTEPTLKFWHQIKKANIHILTVKDVSVSMLW